MPPSSSRTLFRQRPYRKRRPRAVGSDLKGCVLWLLPVHPSDLVHSSCEGASKDLSSGIAKKGKGRRTQRSSSCWDGTTLCSRRTSTSPLFRQTLTGPSGEIAHPSGSATSPVRYVRNQPESDDPSSPTLGPRQTLSFSLMIGVSHASCAAF